MELRRFLAVLALAVIVLLLVVIWFSPSDRDFHTDNPSWNGVRKMMDGYAVSPLTSLSTLPVSPRGTALILIPYYDFVPAELEQLQSFVSRGGTLILADDYAHGNRVLEYLGLKVRFSGQALLDPLSNYKNKWLPVISRLEPDRLTDGVKALTFNHATALLGVETDNTLALSSQFSFLDLDGDGAWSQGEPTGPLPVISQHALDDGRLILISDPSLFINSMAGMEGNRQFIRNVAAIDATLLIDRSHLPSTDLRDSVKNLLAQARGYLATPVGTFGLVILALAFLLRPIWHR
ncbi:MAG: DUF4350 domain-containing protein [Chloroflexi bacterium]|nr:DUF4350 domain-containing protein [Chloroflexota bacterium]